MSAPEPAISDPPQFIGGKARHAVISLDYPIEFAGKPYNAIVVRRLTVREVAAYVDTIAEMAKTSPDARVRPPVFADERGEPLPDGLFDALDDDDALRLDEAAEDFLPRRWRDQSAGRSSSPTDGDASGPTSSTTSAAPEPN